MKRWWKITLGALVLAAGLGYGAYRYLMNGIADAYAQWATAEIVTLHWNRHHAMPGNWTELASNWQEAGLHHGGLTLEKVRARMHIDFARLPELEHPELAPPLPEIITTVSGRQGCWAGAEPNEYVHEHIQRRESQ